MNRSDIGIWMLKGRSGGTMLGVFLHCFPLYPCGQVCRASHCRQQGLHRAIFTYYEAILSDMKQVLESSVPGWNWGENGLVNLALPPFHDGFLWSSLDSEFCRQVENHCPACHPSCTFTVLSNSTSEWLLPQHKGVHNPSIFSGLWCSSAKDVDVYFYLWFLEGLFCTEHSLLTKKKFSMLKSLDLIKSSEHLLSIKDITFISRLFFFPPA